MTLKPPTHNWPIIGSLLFLTGIPALPALFIIFTVIAGPQNEWATMINALHFDQPLAVIIHGSSGVLFFLTMPFQFSNALRVKYLNWHKASGRIAVVSACIMGLSGIWMHHVLHPDVFGMRYLSLVAMSIGMCVAFVIAVWKVAKGDSAAHKHWMMRAIAITLAAVTPLFFDIIAYVFMSWSNVLIAMYSEFQHDYGRLLAIAINLSLVEWVQLRAKPSLLTSRYTEHKA